MAINGATAYHFNRIVPYISMSLTGNYDCSTLANGCPQGSVHTGTVSIRFQSHTQGGHNYATISGGPPLQMNLTAYDFSNCDPIFGDPFSPECKITSSQATVICSVMGTILAYVPNFSIDEELAYTWSQLDSIMLDTCDNASTPFIRCLYNVHSVCDAAHAPPDWDPKIAKDYKFWDGVIWGWLGAAECFAIKMPAPGGWTGWVCTKGNALPIWEPHAPGRCTKRAPGTGSGWDF